MSDDCWVDQLLPEKCRMMSSATKARHRLPLAFPLSFFIRQFRLRIHCRSSVMHRFSLAFPPLTSLQQHLTLGHCSRSAHALTAAAKRRSTPSNLPACHLFGCDATAAALAGLPQARRPGPSSGRLSGCCWAIWPPVAAGVVRGARHRAVGGDRGDAQGRVGFGGGGRSNARGAPAGELR